ncbi:MAG: BON domain-containing protein [Alphaproteobacteria bacterium]|nr:BON domain-containing protein [Alphaproteobacteria bacterium]
MSLRLQTDLQLRQDVLDELDFEPSVNAAHIGVTAKNGVVTLSGHVGSYAEKIAAEQAARRVVGVHGIAQEIEVRYPGDKKTADDEIADRALSVLKWNAVVPYNVVQVKVQDGWVTLLGEVDWQFQREAAESGIRRLSGVAGVRNDITLKPRVQPTDVKRKIEDALKRSAEVEAAAIHISSLGNGKVALEGKVHDWQERDAVKRAAWSTAGVTSIEDRLQIA